jgi:2-oxoacid:acceptor oxidoreductase delta subunit (pyruvate/2-ketoisovalerate family)
VSDNKAHQPKLPKPKWKMDDVQEWGPDRHELGATIPEAGNSIYNATGGWRTDVPVVATEKCNGCMLCYFYCPDASVIIENDRVVAFDLMHCKGCGICAKECPVDAIAMQPEEKE